MQLFLEVRRSDGSVEVLSATGEQMVVGRSRTASFPIMDHAGLDPEHLQLWPQGAEGVWVSIHQSATTPLQVRLSGGSPQPFQAGAVPWGSTLILGDLELLLHARMPTLKPGKVAGESGLATDQPAKSSPIVIIGALAIAGALVVMMLPGPAVEGVGAPPNEMAPLFTNEPVACPTGSPEEVTHRAQREAERAFAKRDRYPFDASDGVESVGSFRLAAACYRALNAGPDAERLDQEATRMRTRIERDLTAHRFRLERAIEIGQSREALYEVRALIAILRERQQDPYLRWLRQTERILELEE